MHDPELYFMTDRFRCEIGPNKDLRSEELSSIAPKKGKGKGQ